MLLGLAKSSPPSKASVSATRCFLFPNETVYLNKYILLIVQSVVSCKLSSFALHFVSVWYYINHKRRSFAPLHVGGWECVNKDVLLLCICYIKCRVCVQWASVLTTIYSNLYHKKKHYCFISTTHFCQTNTIQKDTNTHHLHSHNNTLYVPMLCECTHSNCYFDALCVKC